MQAISVPRELVLSENRSMAWNQRWTPKRWAPEEPYPQAETHFQKFARAWLTQKAEETAPFVPNHDVVRRSLRRSRRRPVALGKQSKTEPAAKPKNRGLERRGKQSENAGVPDEQPAPPCTVHVHAAACGTRLKSMAKPGKRVANGR